MASIWSNPAPSRYVQRASRLPHAAASPLLLPDNTRTAPWTAIKSYASSRNPLAVFRDGVRLLRGTEKHRAEMREETTKGLGVARAICEDVRRLTGLELPRLGAMYIDAARKTFADGSFDFVSPYDVFEHPPEPGAVLDEIRRVLRPGGVTYHTLLPFTAEDGYHDLRIIASQREGIPYWAHLRPACRAQVQNSSYLNEVSATAACSRSTPTKTPRGPGRSSVA